MIEIEREVSNILPLDHKKEKRKKDERKKKRREGGNFMEFSLSGGLATY